MTFFLWFAISVAHATFDGSGGTPVTFSELIPRIRERFGPETELGNVLIDHFGARVVSRLSYPMMLVSVGAKPLPGEQITRLYAQATKSTFRFLRSPSAVRRAVLEMSGEGHIGIVVEPSDDTSELVRMFEEQEVVEGGRRHGLGGLNFVIFTHVPTVGLGPTSGRSKIGEALRRAGFAEALLALAIPRRVVDPSCGTYVSKWD